MSFVRLSCLPLLVFGALACELKVVPGDSETEGSGTDASSSDGGGTEGMSSATSSSSSGTSVSAGTVTTTTTGSTTVTTEMTTSTTSATSVGTSVTGSTSNSTEDPPPPPPPVACEGPATPIVAKTMAFTQAQVPPDPNPTSGSTTGGGRPHPDTVFVRLSSQGNTCDDPSKVISCGPNWEVSIMIPPEFQAPGLYHLLGPDVFGSAIETGADQGGGECSFGGGSFSATFELISIDDQQVVGRLCHVENFFTENQVDLEGSFTAPRCP